ncbi:MAG: hypothetical protein RR091_02880 [Cloacibacillus sp.]
MDENLLLRFDSLHPCWTVEMLRRENEDISSLEELQEAGLVAEKDGCFFLTEEGAARFAPLAKASYIEDAPGGRPEAPAKAARAAELMDLLNKKHAQRWGIKKYLNSQKLKIFPSDRCVDWSYTQNEAYQKMLEEFPTVGLKSRTTERYAKKTAAWLAANEKNMGGFTPDLLYICYYDYIHYTDFKGHPHDPLRLINADRFLFVFCEESASAARTASEFFRWTTLERRVMLPGYFDIDTQEQDSVCWLVFVTEKEERAAELARELAPLFTKIPQEAEPCEIWTISFEALQNVTEKRELIWELLPQTAHAAKRMTAFA